MIGRREFLKRLGIGVVSLTVTQQTLPVVSAPPEISAPKVLAPQITPIKPNRFLPIFGDFYNKQGELLIEGIPIHPIIQRGGGDIIMSFECKNDHSPGEYSFISSLYDSDIVRLWGKKDDDTCQEIGNYSITSWGTDSQLRPYDNRTIIEITASFRHFNLS